MINNNNNNTDVDILARLDAMIVQESTIHCNNYFKKSTPSIVDGGDILNESSRKAMVIWITQVQQTLKLNSETVAIAMSFFDRYLSSGRGNSQAVLHNKEQFQLAAITCFYTATKIYEPVVLGLDMLIQICRDTYTEEDIIAMERDILSALQWKVAVHTSMEFIRTLLELVQELAAHAHVVDSLLLSCQKHMNHVITQLSLSTCKPSIVGISCLASALTESKLLSLTQKQIIWGTLSKKVPFNLMPTQVIAAHQQSLSSKGTSLSSSKTVSSVDTSPCKTMSSVTSTYKSSISPVCVSKMARQA
jgi:hypothetical protein